MAFSYILLLILTGIMGVHNVIVVSDVSVKAGGSITIPCLYPLQYRNHVKYLCEGKYFLPCKIVVKTNQEKSSSEKFSIYDDMDQSTFTVTIKDLTDKDTHYWCAVEIKNKLDVRQYFQLSVTTGMPSLYVNQQEMMAMEGGSVTVLCHQKYPKVTKWCRLGTSCVADESGSLDGTPVSINASVPDVFSVTMSELRPESSGWYLCSTKDFQMPVHITVHEFISATTPTVSPDTLGTLSTTLQHSDLVTSNEQHTAKPVNSTIVSTGEDILQNEAGLNSSLKVIGLITTLLLLLFVGPTAFYGWKIIRRNQTKHEEPDITAGSQTGSASEVPYATIIHNQHVAAQKKNLPEESVTYSTIVMKDRVQQIQ
ncbi:polymeric immunoglobulin receptor-like isoform X2 [Channa argus]|uniref:polymeric immunoglobulin receptor-like isoform X2 n=2 Tax=Channa argus TaxID=215402 RepID=UPI0035212800